MTQQQVGEDIGKVGKSAGTTISAYENGERKPGPVTLAKLAVALKTTSDYLVGLSESVDRPEPGKAVPETESVQKATKPSDGETGIAVTKVWIAKLLQSMMETGSNLDDMALTIDAVRNRLKSMEHQTSVLQRRLEQWFKDIEGPEATELMAMFREVEDEDLIREAKRAYALVQHGERVLQEQKTRRREDEKAS